MSRRDISVLQQNQTSHQETTDNFGVVMMIFICKQGLSGMN